MQITLRRWRRPVGAAVLVSIGLLTAPLLAPRAHAIIGGCGDDPVVVLSDGTSIDLSTTANADASTVQQIVYILHIPAGVNVVNVTQLGVHDELIVRADDPPGSYDAMTRVDATGTDIQVMTSASVVPLATDGPATGSTIGSANENLPIHLTS